MDTSTYKTVTTSRGYEYSYYVSAQKGSKFPILLLHGFPDYADMWTEQIKAFEQQGHTCIAPDMLGYGKTAKPLDGEAYNSEGISQDVADILETENVSKALIVGHDWGAYLAGRFVNWQPSKSLGLVVTNVAHRAPTEINLPDANARLKATLGYEPLGYWAFMVQPDGPALIEDKIESFFSLLFAEEDSIWKTDLTPTGKLEEWLKADRKAQIASYITPETKSHIIHRWLEDGFAGKVGLYKAMMENTHWSHEKKLTADAIRIKVPALFLGGARDAPAPAVLGDLAMKPLCDDYTGVTIDSAHWMLRERPQEWLENVQDWVQKKF